MRILAFSLFFICHFAQAEVGKILKIVGSSDAMIERDKSDMLATEGAELNVGDKIKSQNSVVLLHLYPQGQISLAKNTEIVLTQNLIEEDLDKEKTSSIIDFLKGLVRIQVKKDENEIIDQKIVADGVAFAVRGTEFEVSQEDGDIDLDVIEGEVEVTSPYVQTFVPEVVKPNEGFRFNRKQKNFARRKFGLKFKNHPGFLKREQIREKWRAKKAARKLQRSTRVQELKSKNRQKTASKRANKKRNR